MNLNFPRREGAGKQGHIALNKNQANKLKHCVHSRYYSLYIVSRLRQTKIILIIDANLKQAICHLQSKFVVKITHLLPYEYHSALCRQGFCCSFFSSPFFQLLCFVETTVCSVCFELIWLCYFSDVWNYCKQLGFVRLKFSMVEHELCADPRPPLGALDIKLISPVMISSLQWYRNHHLHLFYGRN